jgi:hypothetical protein
MMKNSDAIDAMIRLIDRSQSISDLNGPVPEDMIHQAEQELGVTFPASYRAFLARYGCGAVGPHEFAGIVNHPVSEGWPDVVWTTKLEREWGLPSGLVEVYLAGTGDAYCLDTGRVTPAGDAPVVFWLPGAPLGQQSLDPVFSSFAELVVALVEPPRLELRRVIDSLPELDDHRTIFISPEQPWDGSSSVVLAYAVDGNPPPDRAAGMTYLLKVGRAKEAIKALRASRGGREASEEDRLAAVLYCAEHGSFLPSEKARGDKTVSIGDAGPSG